VKIKQERQWSLTDSIGSSSAFFAETLQNLFANWSQNIDAFFGDLDEVAEELADWLRGLLSDLGITGKIAGRLLVDGIAEATRGSRTHRLERLKNVFEVVDLRPQELKENFHELSLQALIPKYGYRPVDNPSSARDFKTDFPAPRSTKLLASTGLDGDFGFHKGGYIATCNKLNISSCSGVGVLFW